ncbi:DinB family protein [Halomonas sp. C05BenzN]|uniref:DinB family protein n=1 Tax=Halomonas sp. C05BenzN TaxID=3411041 RepID=UPI003B928C91
MSHIAHRSIPPREGLIEENLLALSQLRSIVGDLAPEHYRQAFGPHGHHTLGKHVRHIIDHYDALLGGLEVGGEVIDYEHRRRDEVLEQWPHQAAGRLGAIEAALTALVERGVPERQGLDYPVGEASLTLETSLGRELAFLTSHTIHHMAIIGLLAEQLGITLPETFGVHPSTLRHWQREQGPLSARSA